MESLGANPRRIQHSSSIERISSLVGWGRAVSFMDTFCAFAMGSKPDTHILPIMPVPTFYVGFLMRADLPPDAPAHSFARSFEGVIKRYCADYLGRRTIACDCDDCVEYVE